LLLLLMMMIGDSLPPWLVFLMQLIWPGLFARHGGKLQYDFDISTLAQLSEGYAAGDLDAVVAGLLTMARREQLKTLPVDVPEVLHWLSRVGGNQS
jgi:hypothetical protein